MRPHPSGTALFLLGYPERALAHNAEGVAHALALGQPQVVAHAHNWGSMLLQLAGELEELDRRTTLLARLADEHGLAIYYPEARILAAWRAVHEERDHRAAEEMRNFLDRRAAMGTVFMHTYFLMLLADAWLRLGRPDEAQAAIKEGLARAEATGEHFCTAELHRLRARACLALDARTLGSPRPLSTQRSPPPVVNRHASSSFEPPAILPGSGPIGASGGKLTTCWRQCTAGSPKASKPPT